MYYYKRLKDVREDNDNTQKQIADVLGIKQQQYERYENGDNEIPVHYLIILAKHYNISLDYLTGLIDEPITLK